MVVYHDKNDSGRPKIRSLGRNNNRSGKLQLCEATTAVPSTGLLNKTGKMQRNETLKVYKTPDHSPKYPIVIESRVWRRRPEDRVNHLRFKRNQKPYSNCTSDQPDDWRSKSNQVSASHDYKRVSQPVYNTGCSAFPKGGGFL